MKENKRVEIFFDFLAVFFAFIYFILLFINIDYFKIPHGDIYQYIGDAKHYAQFEFPWLIQIQPLVPMLIALFQPVFNNFDFPYFAAAKFINISSAGGIFFVSYLILKKHLRSKLALIFTILISAHPIAILSHLDITNISSYTFFSLLALYFIDKNQKAFFITAFVAFLVRVEGTVLVIPYLITNFSKPNKKTFKKHIYLFYFLFLTTLFIVWQSIHNWRYQIPYANRYVEEIMLSKFEIGSLSYVFGQLGTYFFPDKFEWWSFNFLMSKHWATLLVSFSTILLIQIIIFKKTRAYGLYLISLILIHTIFPAVEIRYFFLFLNVFMIGAIICYHHNLKKINTGFKIILFILLGYLYLSFVQKQYDAKFLHYRYAGHDLNKDLSEWIFNYLDYGEYYVITREPFLYYGLFLNKKEFIGKTTLEKNKIFKSSDYIKRIETDQKNINFIDLYKIAKICSNSDCLLKKVNNPNAKYLLVEDSLSLEISNELWIKQNGIFFIREMLKQRKCLKEIKKMENIHSYRTVYILDVDCYFK